MHRPRFDAKRAFAAARPFTFAGRSYAAGDPFPHPDDGPFADRLLARQYEARAVNMTEEQASAVENDPITMTGPAGGRYTINAPWFETPLVVRGKVNAEKALAEVREEGAPLGWIDGGSDVEVEGPDAGGWYSVSAPWLSEPERHQGREAAEARQRELHDAGEPDDHDGYALAEGENGWWTITRTDAEGELKVHGEEAAREAVAQLRAGEAVEGAPWTDEPEDAGEGDQGEQEVEQEETDMDDSNKDRAGVERENDSDQGRPVDGVDHEPNTHTGPGANSTESDSDSADEDEAGDKDAGEGAARPVGP